MNKLIDPFSFDRDHPLSAAMRTISRHWFLSYSKLMSLRWEWSDSIPYGATDGRTLYLNKAGIAKLCAMPNASGLIAFLLVHESLHALLGHGWRIMTMPNKQLANVAADYVVNAMIAMRNRELKREVFPFIEGVLLDEALSGDKSVEQLYRELHKPQQPQPQPQPTEDNDDDNKSEDTEEQADGNTGNTGDDEGGDAEAGPSDTGDADGSDPATDDGSGDSGASGSGSGGDDLSDFVGTGSPDNLEPVTGEGEAVSDVVGQIEESNERILIGNDIESRTSSNSGEVANRLTMQRVSASALSWPDMLREWLNKRSRSGWDSPFNAAIYSSAKLICAGRRNKQAGDIVLIIDTSGSVSQRTYDRFLHEAQCVLDEVKPECLHLLSVSHVVADSVSLDAGDTVPVKLKGGGGTRFQPAFDWIERNVVDPDVVVYLTDGWSDDLQSISEPDYPLLWLCTSRQASDFKTGEVIPINDFQ